MIVMRLQTAKFSIKLVVATAKFILNLAVLMEKHIFVEK